MPGNPPGRPRTLDSAVTADNIYYIAEVIDALPETVLRPWQLLRQKMGRDAKVPLPSELCEADWQSLLSALPDNVRRVWCMECLEMASIFASAIQTAC